MFKTFLDFNLFEQISIMAVLGAAILSFIYAWWLKNDVMSRDKGTPEMIEIWKSIKNGSETYLMRQLKTILPVSIILMALVFFVIGLIPASKYAIEEFGEDAQAYIVIGRTVAFVMGAAFSMIVGQLGMRMAIQTNIRVAQASRTSFSDALEIGYRGGTVTGMLTEGLGLLGAISIFIFFGKASTDILLGFCLGSTLDALFMRVGGGIFAKSADLGADLVGKIEQGIPEDDPRNAGVIADLVGDMVSDCAGMASDVFESFATDFIASIILGLALYMHTGELFWIVFPLIVRGIGIFSSLIGTYWVSKWGEDDAEKAMFKSYELSSFITIFGSSVFAVLYAREWQLGFLVAVGVCLAVSFNRLTAYFTTSKHTPVHDIVQAARIGSAPVILQGLSLGFESAVWATVVIASTIVISMLVYFGQEGHIFYAIGLIGLGLLSQTGNNVAMDSFGSIADNANGIGEMAGLDCDARQIMADLDSVGNTMKAVTKGVAIASAVISVISLFASFIKDIEHVTSDLDIINPLQNGIRVSSPPVLVGIMIGVALPWLFSSLCLRAVNRAAGLMAEEIRLQCKDPMVMSGEKKPDYNRAVEISTRAAQKELVSLTLICITVPLIVGLTLQVEALGGFLVGVILSVLLLAVFMSNSGGAWDNAKKTIEDEVSTKVADVLSLRISDTAPNLGKGSARHKAAIAGDIVGDPLKDTAGPALNPMITVVHVVSLLFAPILVIYRHQYMHVFGFLKFSFLDILFTIAFIDIITWIIIAVLLLIFIWSVVTSKKPAKPLFDKEEISSIANSPKN